MIKAVFLDYTGTVLQMRGADLEEMLTRIVKNSSFKSGDEVLAWWMQNLQEMEEKSYGDSFISEDEICLRLLQKLQSEYYLRDDIEKLHLLNQSFWMYGPLYTDVKPFMERVGLPVYIVTNSDTKYVEICMRRNGLHVHGIVSAAQVKAYKPHAEVLRKAVAISGCTPEEIIAVGDSMKDVQAEKDAGLEPLLLDRQKRYGRTDMKKVYSLLDVLIRIEDSNKLG